MTTITFTLSEEERDWVQEHAKFTDRSVSKMMRDQIRHLRREAGEDIDRIYRGSRSS
jgi:predicted transcriptional regulator